MLPPVTLSLVPDPDPPIARRVSKDDLGFGRRRATTDDLGLGTRRHRNSLVFSSFRALVSPVSGLVRSRLSQVKVLGRRNTQVV